MGKGEFRMVRMCAKECYFLKKNMLNTIHIDVVINTIANPMKISRFLAMSKSYTDFSGLLLIPNMTLSRNSNSVAILRKKATGVKENASWSCFLVSMVASTTKSIGLPLLKILTLDSCVFVIVGKVHTIVMIWPSFSILSSLFFVRNIFAE